MCSSRNWQLVEDKDLIPDSFELVKRTCDAEPISLGEQSMRIRLMKLELPAAALVGEAHKASLGEFRCSISCLVLR